MSINKTFNRLKSTFPVHALVGAVILAFLTGCGSSKRTATGQPEVVNAIPISWIDSNKTKHGYSVQYRFQTADGQTATGIDPQNTLYQPGFKFRVCYDPKNPADSELRHPTRGMDCGKGIF